MESVPERAIVDLAVLPEVFHGVLRAKALLADGTATSAAQAARMAGISRTALYKYRDAVSLSETESGQPVSVHVTVFDRPGVLWGVLAAFAAVGANIRTVNQNIPQKNAAAVSISATLDAATPAQLTAVLQNVPGVKRIEKVY